MLQTVPAPDGSAGAGPRPAAPLPSRGWSARYAALAGDLGIAFGEGPWPLAPGADHARAFAAGVVALAPNEAGFRFAISPPERHWQRLPCEDLRGRRDVVMMPPKAYAELLRAGLREAIAAEAADGLARRDPAFSARGGPTRAQKAVLALMLLGLAAALWAWGAAALALAAVATFPIFLGVVMLRVAASFEALALRHPPERGPPPSRLPVYTVLVPLYREAAVLGRLVAGLAALQYPADKLDIKLVVEEDDAETRTALAGLALPDGWTVVVVPSGRPRTKPRALNAALMEARGDLLTIYDAEDRPDPDQLRRAAARFHRAPPTVACLQARLAIDNVDDTWLTRFFALEYAALFDVINPGLIAGGLPTLLGGTSNHFRTAALREVGGWDAWNVTEDADLAFRLVRAGWRIADLPSTTLEEAPQTVRAWLWQRRRWIKGFLQTAITHLRDPVALFGQAGPGPSLALLSMCLGSALSALLYPLFLALVASHAAGGRLFAGTGLFSLLVLTFGLVLFGFGWLVMILPPLLGAARRGLGDIAWLCLLMPLYHLLASVAAWLALVELVRSPSVWNKTSHGHARTSRMAAARSAAPPLSGHGLEPSYIGKIPI